MRRIAFVCEKGGTGKTTTAVAVGLARRGARVLAVDADQQAHATWTLLGGQGAEPPTDRQGPRPTASRGFAES